MTVGNWTPEGEPGPEFTISDADRDLLVKLGESDQVENLETALETGKAEMLADSVRQNLQWWSKIADAKSDAELIALIRFFTAAEEQLPGWEALDKSSAIAINRILKQRGVRLERDLLVWIREHSRNRFIPNGAIL